MIGVGNFAGDAQTLAVMPKFPRPMYAVMADCGVGEFLWVAHGTEDGRAGANVLSLMNEPEDQDTMSDGLFWKFVDWAREYMNGQPAVWGQPWDIEWEPFNTRGMELTRQLKEELGSSADVRYLRPFMDPGHEAVLLLLREGDS